MQVSSSVDRAHASKPDRFLDQIAVG
jgi:hypothetical protein